MAGQQRLLPRPPVLPSRLANGGRGCWLLGAGEDQCRAHPWGPCSQLTDSLAGTPVTTRAPSADEGLGSQHWLVCEDGPGMRA